MLKQNSGQQTEGYYSLRKADAFPVVASLPFRRERSDDRKCVCCSQARGIMEDVQMENKRFASLKKHK